MKGNVSPIQYDARSMDNLEAQVMYFPATDDAFSQNESFAVSLGAQIFRCFMSDVTACLTREQMHALKHKLDKACAEYPLEEEFEKVGA